jgi:Fur family ferric uptake transcriptional regulator
MPGGSAQKRPEAALDAEARLALAGHRLTRQRRAVLAALLRAEAGTTAAQVHREAQRSCPDLGLATVYRTLEMLGAVGVLRRVHGADHCEAYVVAASRHGHTVVCTRCGRVSEFTACEIEPVLAAAAAETGFAIDDHFLQLTGMCGRCQKEAIVQLPSTESEKP